MPKPIKINGKYKTNLDMPCDGVSCPTPGTPLPHKHRRRYTFNSKEACQDKIDELRKIRKEYRGEIPKGEMSWETFKRKFMQYSLAKNEQTHYRDQLALRYLESYFPLRQLKDLTPEVLGGLKLRLTESGKRAWNVNRVMTALKAMMRFAELSGYISPQMWRLVKLIPTPKGRLHYWEKDEINALYGVSKGIWLTIAKLAIDAGLRREEIHTLKTRNIDFLRNRIHIVGDETWTPKDYERRHLPMKESLAAHLKKTLGRSAYVLGDERPNLDVMTTYFRRLVDRAGLQGSLHTGRHTYGSHLAMAGVPLIVIKERMGHASTKTTEIYAHLAPDKMQAAYQA